MSKPKQRPDHTVKPLYLSEASAVEPREGTNTWEKGSLFCGKKYLNCFHVLFHCLPGHFLSGGQILLGAHRTLPSGKPPNSVPLVDHSGPWPSAANTHKELCIRVCNSIPSLMLIFQQKLLPLLQPPLYFPPPHNSDQLPLLQKAS